MTNTDDMGSRRGGNRLIAAALMIGFVLTCLSVGGSAATAATVTGEQLKSMVGSATKNFQDIGMTVNITYKNKKAISKIDSNFSRVYEFKSASVLFKQPDKLRMEGKLGMVSFEYIINGPAKIFRAPKIKMVKKEDYADDPAKLQDALDIGLVTPSLWGHRRVEVMEDAEAAANNEIKVRLHWPKGDMVLLAWIDAKDLWIKKFEKRESTGDLRVRLVYSNPKRVGDAIWMPTKVDLYAPDGEKAGTSEISDIKVNSGIPDTKFE